MAHTIPPETPHRLEAAIAIAQRWLAAIREHESTELRGEAAAGREDGGTRLLPRIRALVSDIVLPLVRHHQQLLVEVGGLWVGEESWRGGKLPRVFIEYCSRIIGPGAPSAALIFGFYPDSTVIVTWKIKSPLRHTATHLRRFEELSPEVIAEEINAFLSAAIIGRIVSAPPP